MDGKYKEFSMVAVYYLTKKIKQNQKSNKWAVTGWKPYTEFKNKTISVLSTEQEHSQFISILGFVFKVYYFYYIVYNKY